jgi:hypothetical protein
VPHKYVVKIQGIKDTTRVGGKVYEYTAYYLRIPSSIVHLFNLEKGMEARVSVDVSDGKLRLIYEIDLGGKKGRKKNAPDQEE